MSARLVASRLAAPLRPASAMFAVAARPATAARALHASAAPAGQHHVPVGPHSNIDGVYRRPSIPVPSAPLSEHDELTWDDDQAPEPVFDEYDDRWTALRNLVGALALTFGGGLGFASLFSGERQRIAAQQEYPFDNLRLSIGGPNGAPVKKE